MSNNPLPKITEAGRASTRKKLEVARAMYEQRIFWACSQGERIRSTIAGAKKYGT